MFNYNSHYFTNIMSIKFFFIIIIISSIVFSSCISQEELQSYLIDQILGDEIDNSVNSKEIFIELENSPTPFPTPTIVPKPTLTSTPEPTYTPEPTSTLEPTSTPIVKPQAPTVPSKPEKKKEVIVATAKPEPTVTPTPTPIPTATLVPIPTVTPTPLPPTATPIPTPTPIPYEYYFISNVNLGLEGEGLFEEKRVVSLSGGGNEGLDMINDSVYVYLETEDNKYPLVTNMDDITFFVPGTKTQIRGLVISLWTSGDIMTPTVIKLERLNKVGMPDVWAVDPNYAGGRGPNNYYGLVDIEVKIKKY